jgi:glycosyltransferase involved in cell wall biosynthesis
MIAPPLVSVIMPTYNVRAYIGDAVTSVLHQTETDWELLLVDDGSTDGTREWLQSYAKEDPRLRLFLLDSNGGPAKARNVAIANARGRYFAFLDSDDIWYAEKLTRQLALLESTQTPLAYSAYEKIDENGRRTGRVVQVPEQIDYKGLLNRTVIATLTAVYDSERLGRVFMPDIPKRQDYGLWLRILRGGGIARGLPEPLAALRKRPGSVSSDKISAASYVWRVYREVEGLGRVRSAYHFVHYAIHATVKAVI